MQADEGLTQSLLSEARAALGEDSVVTGLNATADSFYSSQVRSIQGLTGVGRRRGGVQRKRRNGNVRGQGSRRCEQRVRAHLGFAHLGHSGHSGLQICKGVGAMGMCHQGIPCVCPDDTFTCLFCLLFAAPCLYWTLCVTSSTPSITRVFMQGRLGGDFDDRNQQLIADLCVQHPGLVSLEMETFQLLDLARCSQGEGRGTEAGARGEARARVGASGRRRVEGRVEGGGKGRGRLPSRWGAEVGAGAGAAAEAGAGAR